MKKYTLLAYVSLFVLSGCAMFDELSPKFSSHPQKVTGRKESMRFFVHDNPALWKETDSGVQIRVGGFSGLVFLRKTEEGNYQFMSHTDRGPNGEPVKLDGFDKEARPFVLPEFQPRWVMLETDRENSTLKVVKDIPLTDPKGNPLRGVANYVSSTDKNSDEQPVDLSGKAIALEVGGIDPEGLTKDSDGNYWMCEEYRPSLLKFSPSGKLIKRFIPKNGLPGPEIDKINKKWGSGHLALVLPEDYRFRKANRGFEGITFQDGKIYATLQSPLDIPSAVHKKIVRIVVFDVKSETVVGELFYPLYRDGVDKMGDLSSLPGLPGIFAIEQNGKTGREGTHLITHFIPNLQPPGQKPELKSFETLKTNNQLLQLRTVASLGDLGFDFAEKVEGLALTSNEEFAVINDNDFGVSGDIDVKTKTIPITAERLSVLGVVKIGTSLGFSSD